MRLELKPISVIKANLGIQPNGPAHSYFTARCDAYMDKFIPYDPGHGGDHLRENKDIGTNYIKYNMPYARYQYFGVREDGTHRINPENYTTPGTGPYWDKEMWSVHKEDIINEMIEYIKTYGGR